MASFWARLFGRRIDVLGDARQALADGGLEKAWSLTVGALAGRRPSDALHLAAEIARARGHTMLAAALDRAGDDPSDTSRLADASTLLVRRGELEAAIAILELALTLAPFDAVLRSELALLLARAARPAESVAALALHPCLADDPGALFQFAWSSLLSGDERAAIECRETLAQHPSARALVGVLDAALERASRTSAPRDLRDWIFVEHGALLLDRAGPHDGAYASLSADDALAAVLAPRVVVALESSPSRVLAGDEESLSAARVIASALGVGPVEGPPRAGIPEGLVVVRRARALKELQPRIRVGARVRTLALVLELDDAPFVPDVIGAIARSVGEGVLAADPREPEAIGATARARGSLLPPATERASRAFLADAPLRWPPRR